MVECCKIFDFQRPKNKPSFFEAHLSPFFLKENRQPGLFHCPVNSESYEQVKEPYGSFLSSKPVCTLYAYSLSSRDPSDRDVNWRPLVHGESTTVQVKK